MLCFPQPCFPMNPAVTFTIGILLLGLFVWYFATDSDRRKRLLGLSLMLILVVMSLISIYPPSEKIRLGLDLEGGSSFLIQLKGIEEVANKAELRDQAVEVIRSRIDALGLSEPLITPEGDDRVLVQVPGLDPERIQSTRDQLGRVAKLDFRMVDPASSSKVPMIQAGEAVLPPDQVILPSKPREANDGEMFTEQLLVSKRPDIRGKWVTSANAFYGQEGYGIRLKMQGEGADKLWDLSNDLQGQRMAIVLDNVIISAPVIQSPLPNGEATITGDFTSEEATSLASSLMNPLETPVEIMEERTVSATLGAASIRQGVIAGLLGIALTLVFMIFYYRFAGLVANIALIVNVLLLFGALCEFKFVLTLPGIAGILLTIGMSVDANVLIYERLREELAMGKSLKAAIEAGYSKAFSSIFDANVTTLITACILFWQASGPVKGFAITLILGILASMFTALLVTRNIFGFATESGVLKKLSMVSFLSKTNIDFLGARKMALIGSLALIVASLALFVFKGEENLGIDFRGGDLVVVSTEQEVSEGEIRDALVPFGYEDSLVQLQQDDQGNELISIRLPSGGAPPVEQGLLDTFQEAGIEILKTDRIGASFGQEMVVKAMWALGIGMIAILIYVTLRFEFSFALGALVAVIHDVIITLGLFSLMGRELSLIMVGAILTIAGYSINDTIVIFDRIREAFRAGRRGSTASIMNEAINATLSRTILTGGTTLFTVGCLLVLGGQTLNDFALAMVIGVIVGTYSSVFVAAPIVLWWSKRKSGGLRREVRDAIEEPKPAPGAA